MLSLSLKQITTMFTPSLGTNNTRSCQELQKPYWLKEEVKLNTAPNQHISLLGKSQCK